MTSFRCSLLLGLALICVCQALVKPANPFDANEDAKKVRKAVVDEEDGDLAAILTHRSAEQRIAIAQAYNTIYKRNLVEDIEDEFSGDFEDFMVALVTPLDEYYAKELFSDAFPFVPDSRAVVDILCTNTNALLKSVNAAFKRLELNKRLSLAGCLNIYYQGLDGRIIASALEGKRNETQEVDEAAAIADAKRIHAVGLEINGWGRPYSQEKEISHIFENRSYKQMQKIITEYEKLYNHGIGKAFIDRVWPGDMEKGFVNMIKVFRSIPKYYASRLHDAMDGMGTNDRVLRRIIIGRSEIDLDEIKAAYQQMYGESLLSAVKDDTSGAFGRAIVQMI